MNTGLTVQTGCISISAIGLCLSPEVGANDIAVSIRVVPDGREGSVVYARTLREDEVDDGSPVVVNRATGDVLEFRQGALAVSITDVDRAIARGPDGYAPITGTIWTWLVIGNPTRADLLRYLLAVARRLDATHFLLLEVARMVADLDGVFVQQRDRLFQAVGLVEILLVALGRSITMTDGLAKKFQAVMPPPVAITGQLGAIRAIRDAYEHIDERALGLVKGKPHPDALTLFDHEALVTQSRVVYGSHSLDLSHEIPQLLVTARQYLYEVAIGISGGPVKVASSAIRFFE